MAKFTYVTFLLLTAHTSKKALSRLKCDKISEESNDGASKFKSGVDFFFKSKLKFLLGQDCKNDG